MELFGVEDLAKRLKVSYGTVTAKIKDGTFNPTMVGRKYVFTGGEFERCVKVYKEKKEKTAGVAIKQSGTQKELIAMRAQIDAMQKEIKDTLKKIININQNILALVRVEEETAKVPKLSSVILKKG